MTSSRASAAHRMEAPGSVIHQHLRDYLLDRTW
jgi:hypothetical protein